jgi:hypothetical protein
MRPPRFAVTMARTDPGDPMPLRLAATRPAAWRAQRVAAALVVAAAALFAVKHFIAGPKPPQAGAQPAVAAAAPSAPPRTPWTIVYERTAACAEPCKRVLDTLNAVSRDPASGVADGAARIVVRETQGEPARDLIVLDPEGQPAGFIVHTTDPGRIVSGLATLRAAAASSATGSSLASR